MKIKKFILLFLTLFLCMSLAFAATNHEYGGNTVTGMDITEATISNNIVIDYIGSFIFAIGNIIQTVVSWLMGAFTGTSTFPWADLVVFNTIPLLDANFINPEPNSLLGIDNTALGIGEIVRNIYFSMLAIAIGFLGIIVGAMAVRLALSSIASEKAKYKEAITTWLTSIVLLFGMHYFLSFLFYLNEQLVIVASTILNNSIGDALETAAAAIADSQEETKKKVVENFVNTISSYIDSSDATYCKENYEASYVLLNDATFREALDYIAGSDTTTIVDSLGKLGDNVLEAVSFGNYDSVQEQQAYFFVDCVNIVQNGISLRNSSVSTARNQYVMMTDGQSTKMLYYWVTYTYSQANYASDENIDSTNAAIYGTTAWNEHMEGVAESNGWSGDSTYDMLDYLTIDDFIEYVYWDSDYTLDLSGYTDDQLKAFIAENLTTVYGSFNTLTSTCESIIADLESQISSGSLSSTEVTTANALIKACEYCIAAREGTLTSDSDNNMIATLGEYFKTTAWTIDIDNGGWAPSQVSVVSAILYVIFIMQSTGFFVQYLKRVLLVVGLAVLGPLVVIYDFCFKAAMGVKKSTFSAWLKELSTLIFVQTFHAFLLAIILSIIVKVIANSSTDGSIEAAGLLCIFALWSLSKLEMLVKQIFGLTSQFSNISVGNGMKSSLAGAAVTLSAGKKLMNNGGKILGGAVGLVTGKVDNVRANRALKKFNKENNNSNSLGDGQDRNVTNDSLDSGVDVNQESNTNNETLPPAGRTRRNRRSRERGITASEYKQILEEMRQQDREEAEKARQQEAEKAQQEKEQEEKAALESRLHGAVDAAKAKRSASRKQFVGGIAETVVAAHGAVAGAVINAGAGASIAEGAVRGAGAGDAVVEGVEKAVGKISESINGPLEKEIKGLEDAVKKLNNVSKSNNNGGSPRQTTTVEKTTKVTNTIRQKPSSSVRPARSTSDEIDNS